jgi:hypothetical protein
MAASLLVFHPGLALGAPDPAFDSCITPTEKRPVPLSQLNKVLVGKPADMLVIEE